MATNTLKILLRRVVNRLVGGKLISIYRMLGWTAINQYCSDCIVYHPYTDIGGALFFSGEFEKKELEKCKEYIYENSIILDIGANIGLHSIYFANLAKKGCVIAFEPSVKTFCLLVDNVSNIYNIVPINIAANNEGSITNFFEASDNAYSSLIDTQRKEIVKVTKVPCMKIDDIVSGLGLNRVDFVKIDTEGLEFNVLRGMTAVISKFAPVIFCEIYKGQNSNHYPNETVKFLLKMGYTAHTMHNGRLSDFESHNDDYYNYLFLPAPII